MNDSIVPTEEIGARIHHIRGQRVMLDQDLAALYGVPTKRLNEQVQRNIVRFPGDFMFQLDQTEAEATRSQIETLETRAQSNRGKLDSIKSENLKSQIATSSWGGRRKLPYAFTQEGVAMLSSVLRSPRAVMVNIEIMRAFIRLRQILSSHTAITKELTDLKSFLLKHSNSNDREFKQVWDAIEKLTTPSADKAKESRRIGFDLNHD